MSINNGKTVFASKIMDAKKGDFPFDPKREEDLIKKLVNLGLDKFLVEKVWRQIISSNLSMQKIIKWRSWE